MPSVTRELRWYLGIIAFSTVTIAANILPIYKRLVNPSVMHSFRWHQSLRLPDMRLPTLASGLHTAGCACCLDVRRRPRRFDRRRTKGNANFNNDKTAIKEIRYSLNPRTVSSVVIDKKPIDRSVVTGVSSYLVTFSLLLAVSVLLVSISGRDFMTNVTAVIACLQQYRARTRRGRTCGQLLVAFRAVQSSAQLRHACRAT